jgi:hypothetical protein
VLNENDMWANLPLVRRELPKLPPEPLRYWGGRAIRRAIIACEEAEERNQMPPPLASAVASLPKLFGLRIGTR